MRVRIKYFGGAGGTGVSLLFLLLMPQIKMRGSQSNFRFSAFHFNCLLSSWQRPWHISQYFFCPHAPPPQKRTGLLVDLELSHSSFAKESRCVQKRNFRCAVFLPPARSCQPQVFRPPPKQVLFQRCKGHSGHQHPPPPQFQRLASQTARASSEFREKKKKIGLEKHKTAPLPARPGNGTICTFSAKVLFTTTQSCSPHAPGPEGLGPKFKSQGKKRGINYQWQSAAIG